MAEFFKGWKRRLGVLTLVMACLFAAAWVRSLHVRDLLRAPIGHQIGFGVDLVNQSISCEIFRAEVIPIAWYEVNLSKHEARVMYRSAIGSQTSPIIKNDVPYWAIVIPLTLLSTWLLLSKPRKPAAVPTGEVV